MIGKVTRDPRRVSPLKGREWRTGRHPLAGKQTPLGGQGWRVGSQALAGWLAGAWRAGRHPPRERERDHEERG